MQCFATVERCSGRNIVHEKYWVLSRIFRKHALFFMHYHAIILVIDIILCYCLWNHLSSIYCVFNCRNIWALLHQFLVDTENLEFFSLSSLWTSWFNLHVSCFPAMHEQTQAGLFCVTSGPYIPTAAISITARCLAHCQLLLGSQPALCSPVLFFSPGENSSQLSEGEHASVTEVES